MAISLWNKFRLNVVGDEVALRATSTDGEQTPATAWEQWDNRIIRHDDSHSWVRYVCHVVLPVMCSPARVEEENQWNFILQPHPAQYKQNNV
nr:hypothetical protein [Bacteroidota bacterium]